jgi:hypothetical protein
MTVIRGFSKLAGSLLLLSDCGSRRAACHPHLGPRFHTVQLAVKTVGDVRRRVSASGPGMGGSKRHTYIVGYCQLPSFLDG